MAKQIKKLSEPRRALLVVAAAFVVVLLQVAIFYFVNLLNNPYTHANYRIDSTQCKQDTQLNRCTILVSIENTSAREFTPDFTGTDGPAFAESHRWGVYIVDSNGAKTKGYLDRDAYSITIPPHSTVHTPVIVELKAGTSPKEIIIFDRTFAIN